MNSLSDRIRLARRRRGLSQAALAARVGVTGSAVGHWERRSGSDPSLKSIRAISIVLEVPLEWLSTGRGQMQIESAGAPEVDSIYIESEEKQLVSLYRLLPSRSRDIVLQILETLCQR